MGEDYRYDYAIKNEASFILKLFMEFISILSVEMDYFQGIEKNVVYIIIYRF